MIKFWTNMWAYEPVKVLDEYVGINETKIKGGSVRTLSSLHRLELEMSQMGRSSRDRGER